MKKHSNSHSLYSLIKTINGGGWLGIAGFIHKAAGFLVTLVLVRKLSVVEYGGLNYIFSLVWAYVFIGDMGLFTWIVRTLSSKSKSEKLKDIVLLKIMLSGAYLLVMGSVFLLKSEQSINLWSFGAACLVVVFSNLTLLFNAVFRSTSKIQYEMFTQFSNSSVLILGIVYLSFVNRVTITIVLFVYAFASMIGLLASTLLYVNMNRDIYSLRIPELKSLLILKETWIFAAISTLSFVNLKIDIWTLYESGRLQSAANYSAIMVVILSLEHIASQFAGVYLPRFSARRLSKENLFLLTKGHAIIGLILVGSFIFLKDFVLIIFTVKYANALPYLLPLLVVLALRLVYKPALSYLISRYQQKRVLFVFLISVVFNYLSNKLVIGSGSSISILTTTIFAELIVLMLLLQLSVRCDEKISS